MSENISKNIRPNMLDCLLSAEAEILTFSERCDIICNAVSRIFASMETIKYQDLKDNHDTLRKWDKMWNLINDFNVEFNSIDMHKDK